MFKVKIFTSNSIDKLHPRIALQKEILIESGYEVEIYRTTKKKDSFIWELLNLFCLKYFKWGAIESFKKELTTNEIVLIYDLQLLPLAKWAKRKNAKVIYETLDDNVYLHFFALTKKIKFLRYFKSVVIFLIQNIESKLTKNYCDHIIVNSPNLQKYYPNNKTTLIYYSSVLECVQAEKFNMSKKSVFLYLGKLTISKGAKIYNDLLEKYQLPLLFYGKAEDSFSIKMTNELNQKILYRGNLNVQELIISLEKDLELYNVIGLSIIIPENESYMFQEANKDIDYLAMNIPFIGNERPPTKEKIEAGAGVCFNDLDAIQNLLENRNFKYDLIQEKQKELYNTFSNQKFKQSFLEVLYNIVRTNKDSFEG
jgi:hypothetical protein